VLYPECNARAVTFALSLTGTCCWGWQGGRNGVCCPYLLGVGAETAHTGMQLLQVLCALLA